MNIPDDVELVVGLGIDPEDRLVIASYLEYDDLESFLIECLEVVQNKRMKEDFTLQ